MCLFVGERRELKASSDLCSSFFILGYTIIKFDTTSHSLVADLSKIERLPCPMVSSVIMSEASATEIEGLWCFSENALYPFKL